MSELTPLQLGAALADEIYRRADADFDINVEDLNALPFDLGPNKTPLPTITTRNDGVIENVDGYYYGMATGFVGRVVKTNTAGSV